jgi:hypothetical protein
VRVFCFSFIIYLVLLVTQPCQDVVAQAGGCCDEPEMSAHFESSSHNEPSEDECSPFCICSCCGQAVASHKNSFGVTLDVETATVTASLKTYSPPDTASFTTSVWQPPKV